MEHPAYEKYDSDERTFGERIADHIASGIGSWRFLILQGIFLITWMFLNTAAWMLHWDVYPFILLNLCLSMQAAYTGPILLLAGKRQETRDRFLAAHDYEVNQRAEKIIETVLAELQINSRTTLSIARKLEIELDEIVGE